MHAQLELILRSAPSLGLQSTVQMIRLIAVQKHFFLKVSKGYFIKNPTTIFVYPISILLLERGIFLTDAM